MLKKSMETVGPLQPILVDEKTGEILLGKHRKNTGLPIPESKIHVKDPLHRELIIVHGNFQRQVEAEETKYHFNRIARFLEEQGVPKEQICDKVCQLVPYSEQYVRRLLPAEYRMVSKARTQICEPSFAKTSLADATPGTVSELGSQLGSLTEGSDVPAFPFKDCRCQGCPNEGRCY
jgi:hypothetical protein